MMCRGQSSICTGYEEKKDEEKHRHLSLSLSSSAFFLALFLVLAVEIRTTMFFACCDGKE